MPVSEKSKENLKKGLKFGQGQKGNPGGRPALKRSLTAALVDHINANDKLIDELAKAVAAQAKSNPSFLAQLWDRTEGAVKQTVVTEIREERLQAAVLLAIKESLTQAHDDGLDMATVEKAFDILIERIDRCVAQTAE